jgi:diadenosine tetraphosphate (Ap4A) HIT family hydrolase
MKSVFIDIPEKDWLHKSEHFFIVKDKYPVSEGHILIVSKELRQDFFDLTAEEKAELPEVITQAQTLIEEHYNPDGYNIGINCREAAGQTVFHFHCHVIPRYKGDMENPRGGIRNVIPGMGDYNTKAK